MKNTSDTFGLCDAIIRVRESARCPSSIIAEAFSSYVNEVKLVHSDSVASGWRRTITKIPAIISKEDLLTFENYSDIIEDPDIYISGRDSWLVVSLNDVALNEAMKIRAVFQKVHSHSATVKYEDFHIYLYPPQAVDSIVKSLSAYGQASLLDRKIVPFAEMPAFKFDLTVRRVLTEEEEKLLRDAIERGWFDYPRSAEARLERIASDLGMGQATLSVHLRQINRKLSADYLRRFVTPF